jgi:cyanophycin synthetase
MRFREVRALRGPNVWARVPVLEIELGLRELSVVSSHELSARLPALAECLAATDDSVERFGAVLLQLSRLAGTAVSFVGTKPTEDAEFVTVAVELEEEPLSRKILATAERLYRSVLDGQAFNAQAEVYQIREAAYYACLGPSTKAIVAAADARGIPWRRLNNDGSLVQFGHGFKKRHILTAETDRTSAVAQDVAQDKELTRSLLRIVGVPVPEGRAVESADQAWAVAQEIGGAVVVKPRDGNHARGVATNLTTREQVFAAFEIATKEGDGVLVEKSIPGVDHRLLVVGDRVVAAARREAARIEGDGQSTIAQLVASINEDPRRGDGFLTPLGRIALDPPALEMLAAQGYAPDSVPPAGAKVQMRRHSHIITGGVAFDVTDAVHPEVAARAVDAARVIGLDVAGIDIVAEDVARPLEDQGAVVVEVNAGPGLGLHLPPWSDPARPVGDAIVGSLFHDGEDGRIPIIAVVGRGAAAVVHRIAGLLRNTGKVVGRSRTEGLFIGDRQISRSDASGPQGVWSLLRNPAVEIAVVEIGREGVRRGGLGFDRCLVTVILDVEGAGEVERTVLRSLSTEGIAVLNVDDPVAWSLATGSPATIFFGATGRGRAVIAKDGATVLSDGFGGEDSLIASPLSSEDLAAAAATWAFGLTPDQIREAVDGAWTNRGNGHIPSSSSSNPAHFGSESENVSSASGDLGRIRGVGNTR